MWPRLALNSQSNSPSLPDADAGIAGMYQLWPTSVTFLISIFLFKHSILCSSGKPQTFFIAERDLELLLFLPPPPECRNCRSVLPHSIHVMLGMGPRASYMLGKASNKWKCHRALWPFTAPQQTGMDSTDPHGISSSSRSPSPVMTSELWPTFGRLHNFRL